MAAECYVCDADRLQMKKFKLLLPFLRTLFSKPQIILKALYHAIVNEDRKEYVTKQYNLYNGLYELDLFEVFPEFAGEVDCFTHLYGTSLPIDFIILKKLAARFTDCDYLEIGSWRGESLANLSPVCKSCVSVSLSDDDMRRLGFTDAFVNMQRMFSHDLPNVKHVAANSRTFDFSSLHQKFDLIFVDGDHSYEGVLNDTRKVFQLLKNENSIIVWHDCVTQYELPDWEVVAGIMDGTPPEKRSHIYHISNSLCAVYLPGGMKAVLPEFPKYPDKNFKVTITSERITG